GGGNAHLIANDRRVLITTDAYSQTTDTNTTRVAVLNTETGNQVGTTLTLTRGGTVVSPDGARALIFTEATVAVLNTITGTATSAALTGSWGVERWSADGRHALISSRVTDAAGTTTRLAVIDTITGTHTGSIL
ncbi:hypothetical protein C6A85_75675, partial [Mycobacterium sp. ITM-2017-0098]